MKRRLGLVAGLAVVFLCGVVVGAVGFRWYSIKEGAWPPAAGESRFSGQFLLGHLERRLQLDPEQAAEVAEILVGVQSEARPIRVESLRKVRGLFRDAEPEIRDLLDPAQQRTFDRMMERIDRWTPFQD